MPDATINPGNLAILMRRGVSFGPIDFVMRQSTGAIIPLTDYTARWIARTEDDSPNEYDLEATIPAPATDGKVRLEFTKDEVLLKFPVGKYVQALVLTDGSGNTTGPVISGPLTVENQPATP